MRDDATTKDAARTKLEVQEDGIDVEQHESGQVGRTSRKRHAPT